jgi:16S rRNA processing protein RimM
MALVRIGKVVRALGLKGYLGVAGSEGALGALERITLRRGGEQQTWRIEEARPQGRLWAVKVEGVSDRTAAERLVGAELLIAREELPEAGEGRLLWADLEGLEVVTAAGAAVGRVTGLYETGAVDVLVVTGPGGEKLVPLAPYVEVDLQARRIVVDAPEGLLE